jgi:hypothetical protein
VNEERVRDLLREARAPDENAAEERGWRVVDAAFTARQPVRRRPLSRRVAIAAATVVALLAAALTPPGQAVADWLREAVEPGREDAREALVSLPAPGRLLVTSQRGPWIVEQDGSKRLLGAYDDASWSPQGLFVVVTRGHEVIALEPGGRPRWSLARPGPVRAARWSPDGFRIAYHAGRALRVVAGDGTGDHPLANDVAAAPAAWWPGMQHRVAYADARGRVVLVDGDTGRRVWRTAPAQVPTELLWSWDGSQLLAVAPGGLRLFDAGGRLLAALPMPPGTRAGTAAFRPAAHEFALVSYAQPSDRSRIELVRMSSGGPQRRSLFAGAGRFGDVAWSPNGRWLLAGWEAADQWVFIRSDSSRRPAIQRLRAVGNVSRQFDPGGRGAAAFPRLGGWCCPPVASPK